MFLNKIISAGVSSEISSEDSQIIRIVNSVCIALSVFCLLFAIGIIVLDFPSVLLVLTFITFSFQVIPIILNSLGYYIWAKIGLIVLSFLIIFIFSVLFGPKIHFHYYLISTISTPLIFLTKEKKNIKYFLSAFGLLIWIAVEVYGAFYPPIIELADFASTTIRIATDLFVITIVFYLIFIFTSEKKLFLEQLQKANSLLEIEKERSRQELQYARKIQTNLLVPISEFNSIYDKLIIFNQPKDIIGGDTYWNFQIEGYEYIAVIDCTGHGVPGGLMTTMIHSSLNEIVKLKVVKTPSEILTELNLRVYDNLNQSSINNFSQDGCDIGLCRINHRNNQFLFSGAGISLQIKDEFEIKKVQSNYRSIGGKLINPKMLKDPFIDQSVDLNSNNTYFLYTDGIEDQLNRNNEAYGSERLEESLIKISELTSDKAINYLMEDFNSWKKDTPQLDDTLLIGFKLIVNNG